MSSIEDRVVRERDRILAEYARREREVDRDLYAPWRADELLRRSGRVRVAAAMLRRAGVFPTADDACLEIGFGRQGWIGQLVLWGVRPSNLHGIELDRDRAASAQQLFPTADLRVGDAASLPWSSESFRLVIASTVFSSILDDEVRHQVASEIERVLAPGGALLWYDFAVGNPRNGNVRPVRPRQLAQLFPALSGEIRAVTLAPPIARRVAPVSWLAATALESIPLLRTHRLACLRRRP